MHGSARSLAALRGALFNTHKEEASYDAYPWLSWDLSFARSTDAWIASNAPHAKIIMRLGNLNVMLEAVLAGLGVSILPCFVGDAQPTLRRVGDYFEGGLFLWVLTHPQLRGNARISAFTRFVRELISRDRDLLEGRCPQPHLL